MFDNIRDAVNILVDQELDKRREQAVSKHLSKYRNNEFNLLDVNVKSLSVGGCVDIDIIETLFLKPHINYTEYCDADCPEDGKFRSMAWLNKDLKTGIVAMEEDEGSFEIGHFSVYKVGKHGRDVKGMIYGEKKTFLRHYDECLAEIILLGLDKTSTESKG